MTGRSFYIVHWAGFILTLFFITLSILDPSGDEYVIHFTTSMMPWILASTLNSFDNKRIIFFHGRNHGASPKIIEIKKPITINIR